MKKSDLKTGMVCETKNGFPYIVMKDTDRGFDFLYSPISHDWIPLCKYDDNLKICRDYLDIYDVMKVYKEIPIWSLTEPATSIDIFIPMWERNPEVRKVTMSEIEEKFGCKVEIVDG